LFLKLGDVAVRKEVQRFKFLVLSMLVEEEEDLWDLNGKGTALEP
jgi:hypothetical protein